VLLNSLRINKLSLTLQYNIWESSEIILATVSLVCLLSTVIVSKWPCKKIQLVLYFITPYKLIKSESSLNVIYYLMADLLLLLLLLLLIPLSLRTEHRASTVPRHPRLLFQFLGSIRHLVGLLGGGGGSVQRKASTCTGQHNTEKRRHTSMPRAISTFDQPKTVVASDFSAIETGQKLFLYTNNMTFNPKGTVSEIHHAVGLTHYVHFFRRT
jgi:hypothetical protein